MDPELKAELEASQKNNPMASLMGGGGGAQAPNPLGNFDMAAYLAGSKKDGGSKDGGSGGGSSKGGVRR